MNSKTSLFNKGIYKATLRRFLWGSVLYFVMLFVTTGMMILLNEDPNYVNTYWSARGESTILSTDYMIFPMLMSVVAPTIVGLLIFRFIHSKKTSIFVHSLPVKREANYISSVLAALTLMAAPVILNAVVLAIMSVTTFSLHFTVGDCIVWMLLNLFALFTMFSAVCFVSAITGNSFAMIGLNILFHTIALIISAAFAMVCEIFLYGFPGEGALIDKVFNNSFITRIPSIMTGWGYAKAEVVTGYTKDIVIFCVIAMALYLLSGILYKKRRMETAEDVAGFNCLNIIFRYLVTFVGAISTFAILAYSIYENPVSLWITVFVVSAVIYFGAEMLLKKTLRVWKSYKGYIGFLVAFSGILCVFAFTNFFGFETNVPRSEKVESVAIYEYYRERKPISKDDEIIAKAIAVHSSMLKEKEILSKREYKTRIHIEYSLRNGKEINRVYPIDEDTLHEIMNSLYESTEYKKMQEEIFTPMQEVYMVRIENDYPVDDKEKMRELIDCIKKDVSVLSYNQINSGSRTFGIEINYIPAEDDTEGVYAVITSPQSPEGYRTKYEYININANYKNTIKWLRDNGYWEGVALKNEGTMYIARDWSNLPFFDEEGRLVDDIKEKEAFIKLENSEDVAKIVDFCNYAQRRYVKEKDRYTVYLVYSGQEKDYTVLTTISREEIKNLFPEKSLDKLN